MHSSLDSKASSNTAVTRRLLPNWVIYCATALSVHILLQACIVPKATCEYTKTCVESSKDASIEETESTSADASSLPAISDGGMTSAGSGSSVVDGTLDASIDARAETDAQVAERRECELVRDCPSELPVCHATERVCTQCDNNFDCNAFPGRPLCKPEPEHVQDNVCVECLADTDCDDAICVENTCVSCNLKNNDGCTANLPVCANKDGSPTCVLCASNQDCAAELPVCTDNQCVLCTSEDTSHCPAGAPVCVTDEISARCVGCRDDGDCEGMLQGDSLVDGLCIDEQCTTCELGTNRNCPLSAKFCVALLPEGDGGMSLFAPSDPKVDSGSPQEQYLSFDHQCVECLQDNACGGSKKGCDNGVCVQCTMDSHCTTAEASVCDKTTHLCVGCSEVGDCAHLGSTPACDIDSRRCVECTAERPGLCGSKVCQTTPGEQQFTCSDVQTKSAGLCGGCLGDTHCTNNSACVMETYEGVQTGYHCLPIEGLWNGSGECGDIRAFVSSVASTSIDGLSGSFCKPRSTSCRGYADYGSATVSNDAGLASCNSDEDCGLMGVDDGVCVPWTETTNRCTYPCVSQDDCRCVSQDNCPSSCINTTAVDDTAQQVCSLVP
jgi:hypothetical protein